eukprot:jgi/Ulvmu1/2432/UM134_0013.1
MYCVPARQQLNTHLRPLREIAMGRIGVRRSLRLASSSGPAANKAPAAAATEAVPNENSQPRHITTPKGGATSSAGGSPLRQAQPPTKKSKKLVTLSKAFEERLWKSGHAQVAGVDEAGRGPLAGPVVAAACIVSTDVHICRIADSKTISEADREKIYEELISHPGVTYGIGIQDARSIDEVNILQATYRAMEAAVQNLPGTAPSAVLVDGNRKPPNIHADHVETIVKGDSKCFSIAAASIIAKVTRDRMMLQAHEKWPVYGFAAHKGYGTKAHMAAVHKHGPCDIHRLTFRPLPQIVEALAASAGGASGGDDTQHLKADQGPSLVVDEDQENAQLQPNM